VAQITKLGTPVDSSSLFLNPKEVTTIATLHRWFKREQLINKNSGWKRKDKMISKFKSF